MKQTSKDIAYEYFIEHEKLASDMMVVLRMLEIDNINPKYARSEMAWLDEKMEDTYNKFMLWAGIHELIKTGEIKGEN